MFATQSVAHALELNLYMIGGATAPSQQSRLDLPQASNTWYYPLTGSPQERARKMV